MTYSPHFRLAQLVGVCQEHLTPESVFVERLVKQIGSENWRQFTGDLTQVDVIELNRIFIKAISIDKHDSDSYYFIGYMYEHGQGVAKNYGKALEHYKIAADLEHESAKKALINLTQIMYK